MTLMKVTEHARNCKIDFSSLKFRFNQRVIYSCEVSAVGLIYIEDRVVSGGKYPLRKGPLPRPTLAIRIPLICYNMSNNVISPAARINTICSEHA